MGLQGFGLPRATDAAATSQSRISSNCCSVLELQLRLLLLLLLNLLLLLQQMLFSIKGQRRMQPRARSGKRA